MAEGGDPGFYDSVYGHFADDLYRKIRNEAFGEDIGQNSWLSADEHRHFFSRLGLSSADHVLEVACGSGGPALFMAEETGCSVTGVDLHVEGTANANADALARGLADSARFVQSDAREQLPFDDASFDALICIDAINHLYERAPVLRDWFRVLRPGGRLLFTDPITVSGMLQRAEMISRSGSMGDFVFTPAGFDEALLEEAGFVHVQVEDATVSVERIADSWRTARGQFEEELDKIEGSDVNADTQEFLGTTALLAAERRLTRPAYLAARPATERDPSR